MPGETARLSTQLLRESDDVLWVRLRELLTAEGFAPDRVALATFFEDDVYLEFGILVSPGGRVHEFELHHGRTGDLRHQAETAVLYGLTDHTDDWPSRPLSDDVRAALLILEEETRTR